MSITALPEETRAAFTPYLSVIVPLYNERDNVEPLVEWIKEALEPEPWRYEVVLVDDGSDDDTWDCIRRVAGSGVIRGVRLAHNTGQTAAMMAGFDAANGDVLVTMDGDLQNDPGDIPALLDALDAGYDLACGWREARKDGLILRKVPSWCANRVIRWLTGVPITDNGCSLKAYRRDTIRRVSLYADQHRFIPALAASVGARITEMPVRHHARRFGESKYGLSRTFKVLVDLITLKMVTTFRVRPLLAFGTLAFVSGGFSLVFGVAWAVALLAFRPVKAEALVFPGAAALWLAVGLYLVMLGLIAEVAVRFYLNDGPRGPLAREI